MNSKKIAFILCVNDEREKNECIGYLDRLIVPEGYEKDVIAVAEAPSMAAGYNAGMHSSDAKYKVYIHQDTYIINQNFIGDMLKVFEDKEVGLLGMIGTRKVPRDSYVVTAWDTGKVYHNGDAVVLGYQEENRLYTEVEAVDGLAMATQYDIEFREDLFCDWDFYDMSECYEFRRAGYKVVVPYQEECWTFHNNKYSKMLKYDKNRAVFAKEYSKDFDLDEIIEEKPIQELEKVKFEAREALIKLVDAGRMQDVCDMLLSNPEFNFLCLKDILILAEIYRSEEKPEIFDWSGNADGLFDRLNDLKWFLKRVEYDVKISEEEYRYFIENYSVQAILLACGHYCVKKKTVMKRLGKYIENEGINSLLEKRLTDGVDFKEQLKRGKTDDDIIYNWENIENKTVFLIVDHLEENAPMEKYMNALEGKRSENLIVFAREDNRLVRELVKEKMPVLCSERISTSVQWVLTYLMSCSWKVNKVIYIGEGDYASDIGRMLVRTNIPEERVS